MAGIHLWACHLATFMLEGQPMWLDPRVEQPGRFSNLSGLEGQFYVNWIVEVSQRHNVQKDASTLKGLKGRRDCAHQRDTTEVPYECYGYKTSSIVWIRHVSTIKWSKMQKGRSNVVVHARRIPSLLRWSAKVCVASEDILIVIVSCINPNVKS